MVRVEELCAKKKSHTAGPFEDAVYVVRNVSLWCLAAGFLSLSTQ